MKIPWISDIYVKTCWSPCFWHPNVRSGSYAISVYTIAMGVLIITYLIGKIISILMYVVDIIIDCRSDERR